MNARNILAKKREFMIALSAIALFACLLSGCGSSTGTHAGITRLDDEGYLYYMDYTKDYYGKDVMDAMRKVGFIDSGCSTFFTHNTDGAPITCRNYDYPHRVSKEDRSLTGLNVVLHCKPEGKYESIAVADAVWCDEENPMFQKGGPDLEGFDISMMDILPYECMDGINDQGLCVSVLRVDIKPGDQPAKMPVASSMLLRYILDDCADVDEAVQKTKTGILLPEDWQDCHLMVTDAAGSSVVIESRNSEISVIPSDICTNFYNNEKKTVEVWPFQNYSKSFVFDVTGNQVTAGQ